MLMMFMNHFMNHFIVLWISFLYFCGSTGEYHVLLVSLVMTMATGLGALRGSEPGTVLWTLQPEALRVGSAEAVGWCEWDSVSCRSCNKEYVIPSIVDEQNPRICNSSHCYDYIIYDSLDEITYRTYRTILGTCSKICGIGQAYGGCLFQRTDVIHKCYDSWWIIHHYPFICIYKL